MNIQSKARELTMWVGLVEVEPMPGCEVLEGDEVGATFYVVTWAASREEFDVKAKELACSLRLRVTDIEESQPVFERLEEQSLSPEIRGIVDKVKSSPNETAHGTFFTWKRE